MRGRVADGKNKTGVWNGGNRFLFSIPVLLKICETVWYMTSLSILHFYEICTLVYRFKFFYGTPPSLPLSPLMTLLSPPFPLSWVTLLWLPPLPLYRQYYLMANHYASHRKMVCSFYFWWLRSCKPALRNYTWGYEGTRVRGYEGTRVRGYEGMNIWHVKVQISSKLPLWFSTRMLLSTMKCH